MNPFRVENPTLAGLVALGIANHVVLTGNRVTVTLEAIKQGHSTAVVGALVALYAFLPMLCAIAAGRISDRIGARKPMLAGSLVLAAGALIPVVVPGLFALFASAALVGVAFMTFQVASQNATGELGGATGRVHNFSQLALGYSISGLLGPLVAGFTIDHAGFATSFAVLAAIPLIPAAVLASGRLALPGPHAARRGDIPAASGGMFELIAHRKLRGVFIINVLLAMGWDLHTIVIPVYGAAIGLSASQIGLVLASFAAATFLVRFSMRWIVRRATPHQVLTVAMFIAGTVYMVFPFVHTATALMAMSFALGLGLGMSQPMVMSLLHSHAPPGRTGEAAGVRMSLVQSMACAVPLAFGALGATVGLTPVFWSVGLCLATGGWLTKRGNRRPN
ncbi:MAG TPA: MFS transporter [Casimicrobiaceae bacterium]|nr:MFS transporter [Casimicrobiaceae bacterium]